MGRCNIFSLHRHEIRSFIINKTPNLKMKKKTVLILCPWYDPYRIPLLRELAHDFEITVLYTMPKEIGREWQPPDNLPFPAYFLPPIFLWKTKQMFGQHLLIRYPAGLVQMLMNISPDLVVGLEFRFDCIIGALWAHLHGRSYVTWSDMTSYHDIRMGILRRTNRKFMLSLSHALIGSCTDTLNHFRDNFGYPRSKSFLSSLSAHIQEYMTTADLGQKTNRKNDGQVRFVYVGELTPRKGVDLLVRAFAQLLAKVPDAVLTLVGKGEEMEALKILAKTLGCENAVIFQGSIPYESVPREMVCHDVFVLPTRLDVFGLVVAEAVACGLPIICSCYAGVANDLVKKNGLIVDPKNLAEMAEAMEKMARNPQMRLQMAEAGKLLLEKNDLKAGVTGYTAALQLASQSARRAGKQ
ncbi:MAG: glycosyltransferase family 1 protein [Candidatus Electrothrix sp. AR3]|nr:glycosyltransferase family 1 protein [Candidatus Electrothrix sp. AR3]